MIGQIPVRRLVMNDCAFEKVPHKKDPRQLLHPLAVLCGLFL